MRTMTLAAALFLFLGAHAATAQEPIEAPDLSAEESWARAVSNLNALALAMIRQGRDHGMTAEEVGARMGELFGPSWSREPGTGTPAQLVRGMAANLQLWPDAEVSIEPVDGGGYALHHNRPWMNVFGDDGTAYDVSVADYEAMWNAGIRAIGDYLGLAVEMEREGDGWVMTVRDAM